MTKNQKNLPFISIVMPVYNAAEFLDQNLSSIIKQSYQNWELIAVDDWSTDNSYKILQKYAQKDKRINVYRNGKHRGVAGAANLALARAKGQFIARMDADDVMHINRLEKQVKFLVKNPQVVAVGSQCRLINEQGKAIGVKLFPLQNKKLVDMLFCSVPIQQPAMMVNSALLPSEFEWYQLEYNTAEEVDLLFKFIQYGKLANLPEKLLYYRIHKQNTSLKDPKKTFYLTFLTRIRAIRKYNYSPSIKAILINMAQLFFVFILPQKWIYPVYNFLRSFKLKKIKLPKLSINKFKISPAFVYKTK